MQTDSILKHKERFVFQWHVNEICNLRCIHCYQDSFSADNINESEINLIIQQISEFSDKYRLHVNLSGGEPFLHSGIFQILSKLNKIQGLTLGILSNGTLITDSIAYELKTSGVKFIQISIDGSEKMHDSLRGKGSWEKALKGIKTLRKVGIDVHISFTANQKNFKEYPEVVKLSNKLGVVKVWTDRVICNPEDDKSILGISKEQTIDYMRLVAAEHSKKNRTHASAGRALQFLLSDGEIYSCSASKNLLAILPGGNVLPCRRLPIEIGNIYKDSLWNILNQSEFSKKINSPYKIEGCRNCYYEKVCNGGLKCLSYAVYGNPFKKDPGCWQPDRKNQI